MGAPDKIEYQGVEYEQINFAHQSDCGIYKIVNLKNNKIYIGSSSSCKRRHLEHRSRLRRNVHVNKKLQSAWNKYGEESFLFEPIFFVLNEKDLIEVEQYFLNEYLAVKNGYNLSPSAGRTAGWKASDATRIKMSEAAKKRDNSLQVIAMQKGRKDKPLSLESRERMSKSAVNRSRYSQEDRKKWLKCTDREFHIEQ